jgi:hypothetical protein
MKKNIFTFCLVFIFLFLFYPFISSKSSNPWIFGRYSLSDFFSLVLILGTAIYILFLKFCFRNKFIHILAANILAIISFLILIELGGQIYVSFFPSYTALATQPDPVLGWKFVPNMKHRYTGKHWYAREYSAKVKFNTQGFRDKERAKTKDKNLFRVAILGDSIVAARQVGFEKTASQLLEKKLNHELGKATGKKFEVFNFGVANFGLSQYYLTWQNYASKFNPDIVLAYIFEFTFLRTINLTKCSSKFKLFKNKCLSIRPVFTTTTKFPHFVNPDIANELDDLYTKKKFHDYFSKLSNEGLFLVQPKDYKKYVQAQEELIKTKFGGKRVMQKKRKIFVPSLFKEFQSKLQAIQRQFDSKQALNLTIETRKKFSGESKSFPAWLSINHLNFRLLGELSKTIKKSGIKFIAIDTFKHHSKSSSYIDHTSDFLYQSSKYHDFSYIPLYKNLNDSIQRGISPQWKYQGHLYEGHLNEIGNQIFADAMYSHIAKNIFPTISKTSKKN